MRVKSLILPTAVAVIVGALALALGHSRGTSGAPSRASGAAISGKTARLRIANYAFTPAALTVRVGTTLTVMNADSTAHTATAPSGGLDSGTLKPGQSASVMLSKPGTYTYICQFHAFMSGTIKVVSK